MTFKEHTYQRRLRLSSLWSIDEIVYGEIGPKINTESHGHDFDRHFAQSNAQYPNALPEAITVLRPHFHEIMSSQPTDFEQVYDMMKSLLWKTVHGVGLLTIYDIALRIGCNLRPRVVPEKYVYTHHGMVEEAAKVLLPEVNFGKHKVDVAVFSSLFPHYSAMEIEDILCVYHDQIMANRNFDWKWLRQVP